jgi:hypothetical protein
VGRFAVIDTETNWADQVMSIGTIIADTENFRPICAKYHILDPEYQIGGMFSNTLFMDCKIPPMICSREEALDDLAALFRLHGITSLYAYNAPFDRNHLPEFRGMEWYDIMRLAAYRQHNPFIPCTAECCSTGRLKRGYGVEAMLRLLSGQRAYQETHNAILDAYDELEIMCLLGHPLSDYQPL